ncbi:MAG: HAD family hydrolase [Chloroflexi bacterium]|nr:HAD family hydrolase [Chloroflexota bacterium]
MIASVAPCGNQSLAQTVADCRGLVFDLFHTLTCIELTSTGPHTAELLGIERVAWSAALNAARWRLLGEERDPHTIIRRVALDVDPTLADTVIGQAAATRVRRFARSLTHPPAESLRVLRALGARGKRLGLISDADAGEVAAWPRSSLAPQFACALFSCDEGLTKPDPRIYARCLERLELPASACLFIGNGGSHELAGARAVGMGTVLMAGIARRIWPERPLPDLEHADYVIDRLDELLVPDR